MNYWLQFLNFYRKSRCWKKTLFLLIIELFIYQTLTEKKNINILKLNTITDFNDIFKNLRALILLFNVKYQHTLHVYVVYL